MNEREFIKLVRELHLLQLKVLGEEHLSIEIRLSRIKPAASDSMYTGETKNKNSIVNKRILNEIKEKVKQSLLLYGGRERSEAERSDAPIK